MVSQQSIADAVYAALGAAIVGVPVFKTLAPEQQPFPYVVYILGDKPWHFFDGDSVQADAAVTVYVAKETGDSAAGAVRDLALAAIHGQTIGEVAWQCQDRGTAKLAGQCYSVTALFHGFGH